MFGQESFFQKQPPESLFRYRSIKYADDEIRNNHIHLSSPSSFNDPFDSCYSICGADSEIRDNLRKYGLNGDDYLADLVCAYTNSIKHGELLKLREQIKVCCFSERNDSLSMWTHYASYHRDICIEYDASKMIQKSLRPWPVLYTAEMESRPFLNNGNVTKDYIRLACLNKSKEYSVDKEWRIIKTNMDTDKLNVTGCIKAIYLGARYFHERDYEGGNDEKIKLDDLVNFCIENNILVHRMMTNFSNYSLDVSPIYDPRNPEETKLGKWNYNAFFSSKIQR